jgi:hypothetical protein
MWLFTQAGLTATLDGKARHLHADRMFSSAQTNSTPASAAAGGISPHHFALSEAPALFRLADSRKQRRADPVADPVERVLTRALGDDPAYARKVALVRRYQRRLRGRLDAPSWQLYLQVEEAEIGRWTYALERVVDSLRRPRRRSR